MPARASVLAAEHGHHLIYALPAFTAGGAVHLARIDTLLVDR
jgi:hypothetical protein